MPKPMPKPKPPRIPPIQLLAAFEASARCASFKVAAKELNVTPSAVSQQIKALEQRLGLTLFVRKTRAISLSSAGEAFYQVASQTLNGYEAGYAQFKEQHYSAALNISMFSYIANEVVIPKLGRFQQDNPHIDLIIETSMEVQDLASSDLDCAIRFGTPPWENCQHELISSVSLNILASKQYLENNPIHQLSDLQGQTFIHIRTNVNDWQTLLAEHRITPKKELFFNSYTAAIKAAEQGLGIVMGLFPTTDKIVREGKLVALFPEHIPIEDAYYFVSKPNDSKQESYKLVHTWLKELFGNL